MYYALARLAKEQGLNEVASTFIESANQEAVHAGFYAVLSGKFAVMNMSATLRPMFAPCAVNLRPCLRKKHNEQARIYQSGGRCDSRSYARRQFNGGET